MSLSIIQLDQNKQQIEEKSTKKPKSYENLTEFITQNFKINSYVIFYFDKKNKEVYITNNEEYKKSSNLIFIIEKKALEESAYNRIYPNLTDSKKDVIDEKYLCSLCYLKLTENPYYCYQCSKRICKKCLTELSKIKNPLQCPFCKYELPFEKWLTLKNFTDERKQYLEIIENNIKSKGENFVHDKKEDEFLKQIRTLTSRVNGANKKIKNLETVIKQKDEEIKKLNEEINRLKKLSQENIQEKNKLELLLEEINKLSVNNKKKENNTDPKAKMNKTASQMSNNKESLQINNNKIENGNLGGWVLIFSKKNGQKYKIQVNPEELVSEVITNYKKKSLDNGNNKYLHNGKELSASMKICKSGLQNGSEIVVIN